MYKNQILFFKIYNGTVNGLTPLMSASKDNRLSNVKELIKLGADINFKDKEKCLIGKK